MNNKLLIASLLFAIAVTAIISRGIVIEVHQYLHRIDIVEVDSGEEEA